MSQSSPAKLKRFYKEVSVTQTADGWQVLLDGKPMRTPMKAPLHVPTEALAQGIAAEWDGQGEDVLLHDMPLTQFSCAAIDYVAAYREDVLDEALEYATTDALCYRAEEPEELADRQHEQWQPHLDWAKERFGAGFRIVGGIMPVPQPPQTLAVLRQQLEALEPFVLAAVWLSAKHCGSLVLALAVHSERLQALDAYAVSRLEEEFQIERWGEDEEAQKKRLNGEKEMEAVGRFLKLVAGK